MNQDYIKPDNWSIIEEEFNAERVKSSESLFSIGNGAMGQRANFEEAYTGHTFQGSYIAGIYYPDKTKVGWCFSMASSVRALSFSSIKVRGAASADARGSKLA